MKANGLDVKKDMLARALTEDPESRFNAKDRKTLLKFTTEELLRIFKEEFSYERKETVWHSE